MKLSSPIKVYLKPKKRDIEIETEGLEFKINEKPASTLWENFGENMKKTELSISDVQTTPVGKWKIDSGIEGLDKEKIDDVLILLTYTHLHKLSLVSNQNPKAESYRQNSRECWT